MKLTTLCMDAEQHIICAERLFSMQELLREQSGTRSKCSVSWTQPADCNVPEKLKSGSVKHHECVWQTFLQGWRRAGENETISHLKAEETEARTYRSLDVCSRNLRFHRRTTDNIRERPVCLLRLQTHWQVGDLYPVYFHV